MTTDKHTLVERDEVLARQIAAVLDHPSLYMGGPSRQSLMTARRLLPVIEEHSAARIAALEAEKAELAEALNDLIDHCWETEKALTEKYYHMDYCGESLPLTNGRAALAKARQSDEGE